MNTEDKDGHYIVIKGSTQEDITIVNIYAPNTRAPQYKANINSNTLIVGDFNTPFISMDSLSMQKIN